MATISALEKTLGDLLIESKFRLDNRTSEDLLNRLSNYAALIPFDDNDNNWSDFFFMANNSPSVLSELFDHPEKADGNLLPQQAFLLAFLQLAKTPRALFNTFPARHRDLYYRDLLGLQEQEAAPDSVALGFTLSNGVDSCFLPAGTRFDGGKDASGRSLQYALDDNLLVNRGFWSDLRWVQPDASDDTGGQQQLAAMPFGQLQTTWPRTGRYLFDPTTAQQKIVTGRMIASEVLAMSSGERTLTLTFASDVDSSQISVAQVSSAAVWLDLTLPTTATTGTTLTLTLSESAPAISAPDGLDGITAAVPYLKIGRTDGGDLPDITELIVQAVGSAGAYYSTDDGVNRLDSVSYPLGVAPIQGNGFNLMMPQWCGQSVALTVTLTPQWIGLPDESFPNWYDGYDSKPADNGTFKLQPLLMSSTGSQALSSDGTSTAPQSMFSGTDAPLPATLTVVLPAGLLVSDSLANNPCDWPQWLRLELAEGEFGYQDYQTLAGTTSTPLNPPYTPQMKSLTMSYSATDSDFSQYMLTPFGYSQQDAPQDDRSLSWLYLGFTDSQPGDTLSLYWQMQSPKTMVSDWQYLNTANQWMSLARSLTDGTKGMLESGLWSVTLPEDISSDAPWMPANRCWIRAVMNSATGELDDDTPGYIWLQDVIANSMTATLLDTKSVDERHFQRPLAARSITRPVVPVDGLSTVSQPYPSWGGQARETAAEFYTRSAARLFHRDRALAWQDMGAILKAQYANVWDVVFPTVDVLTQLPAPQTPVLLVIPVNEKKDNQDPLRPAFSQSRLHDMASYLQALASPWCQVQLSNPRYRDVAIAYDVSFNVNPDYGYRQLQERLTLHYMPWIVEKQRGVTLGNTLDYYAIIAWIQQLPFVVQVNTMTLDGVTTSVQGGSDEVLVLSGFTSTSVSSAKETA